MANEIKPIVSTDISAMGAVVGNLMADLRQIIDEARIHVASTAKFAQEFPDWQIVSPLVSKLSWTHFLTIMTLKDPLQREFYLTMAANERWSKRTLQSKIDEMLYERTALSSKPEEVVKQELANVRDNKVVSPDVVFKSPYFLEFTGLKGLYSEKDLLQKLNGKMKERRMRYE